VTSGVIPSGMSSGGPVAVEAAVGEPRAVRFAAAEHTHDDVSPVERPRPAPSTSRTMIAGACALCPCVSARRWYRLDEDVPDDDPDASPDVSYVAGKGTSRERRLPLILAPRARWTGSGAEAPHGAATLCPHCHVQNEQLWAERGVAAAAASPLDSVRRTMNQFDRIMSILAPRHRGGGGDRVDRAVSRPRRRAAKNGTSTIHPDGSEMSRSAPAATSGADLMMGRAAASAAAAPRRTAQEEAALREELADVARLGHRRRRRWANDRLLRELGGPMTVSEMQAQFMPPPFGAPPVPTPFESMLAAQARGEWTGFHRVDMDKEAAFLAKMYATEAEARRERARGNRDAATRAWSRTNARARAALRSAARRSPERIERLEATLLDFADGFAGADAGELVLPLADGFARLLAHGLCEFHGLPAHSRVAPGGAKELVVKPPPAERPDGDGDGDGGEEETETKAEMETEVETEAETETEAEAETEAVRSDARGARVSRWRMPETTCAAFLARLEAR